MGQLYGNFDQVTHEWTDGILAKIFRSCTQDLSGNRQWIIFDGPVDALWIENMNTVLDDNKKLCLMSGEIVQMSNAMNMIFEVQDLAVASPATVSRCGMVYMEPHLLGWNPLVTSWIEGLPETYTQDLRDQIQEMVEWLVSPMLHFNRKYMRHQTPCADANLVRSLLNLLSALLEESKFVSTMKTTAPADLAKRLEGIFVFSVIWSIGAVTDAAGQVLFDAYLRTKLGGAEPNDTMQKMMKKDPSVKKLVTQSNSKYKVCILTLFFLSLSLSLSLSSAPPLPVIPVPLVGFCNLDHPLMGPSFLPLPLSLFLSLLLVLFLTSRTNRPVSRFQLPDLSTTTALSLTNRIGRCGLPIFLLSLGTIVHSSTT
eukprot:TRINITY_DN4311_c0_g1_i1.p1 TRINITY_DN4311_c0_g1~~TRINITY_DN4311_c0_g1_i1.p1  ORF type:complete len:380 (+),score=90.88 TRINITY_DN4311_c0_g1_i1:36-1142(+)